MWLMVWCCVGVSCFSLVCFDVDVCEGIGRFAVDAITEFFADDEGDLYGFDAADFGNVGWYVFVECDVFFGWVEDVDGDVCRA